MHVAFGVFAGVFLQVHRKTSPAVGNRDGLSIEVSTHFLDFTTVVLVCHCLLLNDMHRTATEGYQGHRCLVWIWV